MDEVTRQTTTRETYRGDDFTPSHGSHYKHKDMKGDGYQGTGWGWVFFLFIVVWILFWLTFWIADAKWSKKDDGEQDLFKTAAVALILAIIVCIIIYGARWKSY